MPRLRRYDRHVAARNPVVEFLQPFGLLFDFGPNGLRRLGILKSDIERHLHLVSPYFKMSHARRGFLVQAAGINSVRSPASDHSHR
jgi:hypothetical protein